MVSALTDNLGVVHSCKQMAESRESLTKAINRLASDVCNIYTTKHMFREPTTNRLKSIFTLLTSPKEGLAEILSEEFLELNKDEQTGEIDSRGLLADCLTLK